MRRVNCIKTIGWGTFGVLVADAVASIAIASRNQTRQLSDLPQALQRAAPLADDCLNSSSLFIFLTFHAAASKSSVYIGSQAWSWRPTLHITLPSAPLLGASVRVRRCGGIIACEIAKQLEKKLLHGLLL